jgi:hypothetical protein
MVSHGKIPPPRVMKIDVEDAELRLLEGALHVLTQYHPTIFLATHSAALDRDCRSLLRSLGYDVQPLAGVCADWADELIAVWPNEYFSPTDRSSDCEVRL